MMNYAEQTIPKDFKDLANLKIAKFYEELLRNFYNTEKDKRDTINAI